MPRHHERRSLPYGAEAMYDLVADVGRYSEFLPWVSAVRVQSNSETEMVADLIVGFSSLRERFTSRVVKSRPRTIHVDYVDGPLKFLRNDWTFEPTAEGCTIDFSVEFAFKNRVFEAIAGQVFDQALRKMINAFEKRAAVLYPASSGISSSSAHRAA
ncbi:MAG: type II toxin-antitoxin system RatA family toxin [Sphingomonadales bacterium]